jgi:hypothetical protein
VVIPELDRWSSLFPCQERPDFTVTRFGDFPKEHRHDLRTAAARAEFARSMSSGTFSERQLKKQNGHTRFGWSHIEPVS